ncbi:MAG: endonuclease/exonuclease/phosphatase family protein [Akkermansiaceae bacterium]|nr:endonuclease/exonuclease/phosphatase family protein [Akkermansiaceae bacterium]NNM28374.1 endonuclease/exonuclease/phosphatase family protein [Akkermansiaceae bacterium]
MNKVLLFWLGLMVSGWSEETVVATFNIRYASPSDKGARAWPERRKAVLEIIRDMDSDVVGLQEALWSQVQYLRPALPGYKWAGSGRDDGKKAGEFCAVGWKDDRFRLLQTGIFWLSDTPHTAGSKTWGNEVVRICTWVRLIDKKTGTSFYVFNTHWDHKHQGSRERAARMVAAQIDARQSKGDPVILMGDFNAKEDNPAVQYLTGNKVALDGGNGAEQWKRPLVDVFDRLHPGEDDRRTFHGWKGTPDGRHKIDHIFASKDVTPRRCSIVRDAKDGAWPSDHFPVRAVLQLPAP